ncbi:flagellar hook-associated protein FlgK [Sulfurimonas sp.]|nr:flagellar hook-associated protein FlgK [Sulfurimonas sp.]
MASIFNTLNIGYSGLNAAQVGVTTTSHNISNAETDGYTRQRVITSPSTPLTLNEYQVGNGVDITSIQRVFDNFIFDRYSKLSGDKEYSDFVKTTMEELSTYFPEVDEVGIKADLQAYYNAWQSFSDNPGNDSIKLALAKQTENLTENIQYTQDKILGLQNKINDQLNVNIIEVNALAEELASLNKSIQVAESGGAATANDLRDKRNVIEVSLSKLIGAKVHLGEIKSDSRLSTSTNIATGSYSLSVDGFNIVDGGSFHPIKLETTGTSGFHSLSYERQDGVLIPMNKIITSGRVGAILALRGSEIDNTTSGIPTDGILQNVVAKLDSFAVGLIESTNNIYAATNTTKMESNRFELVPTGALVNSGLNIKEGAFDVVIHDIDGNEVARRVINIDSGTSMSGIGSNSIEEQITSQGDDNADGNANNDIDDFIPIFNFFTYANGENGLEIELDTSAAAQGYTFSIQDNLSDPNFASGSNFAGALGLNRFFDGDGANNIELNFDYRENSSLLSASKTTSVGDNRVALDMMQQQFENFNFNVGDSPLPINTTIYGMFDVVASDVGVETNRAILNNETIVAQYNATELQFASVSKVSIDEELTNLIKYQTSYGAASKVITTIDQMMQTLLGIKQ